MVQTAILPAVHGDATGLKVQYALQSKLRLKTARVGVIGLGYVGLPLTLLLCRSGLRTTGFDIDSEKIDSIKQGKSYISHIPALAIAEQLEGGRLHATSDFS